MWRNDERPYPADGTDRTAVRRRLAERIIRAAEARAVQVGRSMSCREGRHVPGCPADPADCLCSCHDPEASRG